MWWSNPTRVSTSPLSFRGQNNLPSAHLLERWAFFAVGTRLFLEQGEGFATFLRVPLYAEYERQVRLVVSVVSQDKKEVRMMLDDLYWAEWEMDCRVTSVREERERDRLARLCSEAEQAKTASHQKGGDLQEGKLADLGSRLRAAASEVFGSLWGNSLQKGREGS